MSPLEYFGIDKEQAESIWPSPVESKGVISYQNAIGIPDPRERWQLERAVGDIKSSERIGRPLENPNSPKLVREILSKCGIEMPSAS